jgi:hypothetical protein
MLHMNPRRRSTPFLLIAACVVMAGCGKDDPAPLVPMPVGTLAPDFTITDVNPASGSYNQPVSPRSQLGKVSAWYFGHAT